ncbi:hypothetical protein MCOR02_010582 [Pyricularia oryzae]|nr:hypothetical protein MCOR02_010582 [Pyricularia oryzae]KAI6324697.1 hypothetical protein MCOR34_001349 [Pyricularia oryzae]KAI6470497.1 hypothetical protein MCOR17_003508 [Pyricularia oryzae]KAI6499606.1 hypothetical protein MCOR13_006259 [Pyricularia oryzae]
MTSIDDLFKSSGVPSKRKLDPVRDPNEIYKSAKLNPSSSRHAQVQDDDDVEAGPAPPEDDEDGDYGPSAPPEDDIPDDDEDGRFFGGGITRQEAEVLDFVESADSAAPPADDKFDAAWLRRTALALEKKINRNAELRARHADDPAKFIDSEADLDAAVRNLSILAEHPSLYPEFARLGTAGSLTGLLAHENTDIALAAVQIVAELTGDDVEGATEDDWAALVDSLLEADLLSLLVSNLERLDEAGDEADREGVYRILEVVENLCGGRPATAETVGRCDPLVKWLLARATKAEEPVSQNKQYAAEMLAILAQASPVNRDRLARDLDAVEPLLQLVAPYRARDPERGGDEEEFMENCFEALTCIADRPEGKQKFVDAEGYALCLVLIGSPTAKKARTPALRLLDHAVAQSREAGVCEQVVEYGGLKTLFTLFMKSSSSAKASSKKRDPKVVEHLISIFACMLRLLPTDSAERIRTLAKFVEKDYEKTERLVLLRREYAGRVAAVDAAGMDELDEDERFSRRLDAGLFVLQSIDVILAWLVAEDDGAKRKIQTLLADRDETLELLSESLKEQADAVDVETENGKEMHDMLTTLREFLQD